MSRSYEAGPGEGFAIAVGDAWEFEVVPATNLDSMDCNPIYPTRLKALEAHLRTLERERDALAKAIARAKRLRRAWPKESGR